MTDLFLWIASAFFVVIAVIDMRRRIIPNALVYPAILITLALRLLVLRDDPRGVLLGGVLAFGVFALTAYLKPGGIGGGDTKLAALIGFLFGFPGVLYALLIGGTAGALVAVTLLVRGKTKDFGLPYAPFLCAGALVVLWLQGVG